MNLDDLALTIYGNPVLRARSEEVTEFDPALQSFIDRMFEVMYEEGGVGLAAPQVGVNRRIMVLDVPLDDETSHVAALVNPEILEHRGTQTGPEGCLSVPGLQEDVTRHDWLRVRGLDGNGEAVEFECRGLLSRAVQHEVDHLEGVLYVDRLNPVRRRLLAKKLKRIAEERVRGRP
jgi:peptide deformylase